jgi:hypothetical protein
MLGPDSLSVAAVGDARNVTESEEEQALNLFCNQVAD